ncbi:MAG: putative Fe-S cluster assembly protein SufT [Pseudomonadales bacterium]|nr:putative Fe-S cluster assembly protein SufT [Pseudomonadales bacterium]
MEQRILVTQRECPSRLVPSGEPVMIPKDVFINVVQDLGGNYTVIWQGKMLRIDGTDADAVGLSPTLLDFKDDGSGSISREQIEQTLDSIYDPEIPISLLQLGLIYDIAIDQDHGKVSIQMTLTAPGCGMGPVLVNDVQYRVRKVPNVKAVEVELVFDPPWSKEMMSEEAQLEAGLFF